MKKEIKCPKCNVSLSPINFYGVEVDYCPDCLGFWLEKGEISLLKEKKDKNLKWVDIIDLWKDEKKFSIFLNGNNCPSCNKALYKISYGDSDIIIDVCDSCFGIWLDKGEFEKIIDWTKKKANYDILNNYSKSLIEEFGEIFVGPKKTKEEILDFLIVLSLFKYKFLTKYPKILEIISALPK